MEVEAHKRAAAVKSVDLYVKNDTVVGLGTGEMVSLVTEEVGKRLAAGSLQRVVGVPTSEAAASEAAFHGVPLAVLPTDASSTAAQGQAKTTVTRIDVAFEQADQLDAAANAAVKGVQASPQQPQLVRAREVATKAAQLVLLVEEADVVPRLTGTLPLVIEEEDWEETAEELDDIFVGDAELWRRGTVEGVDPRGGDNPYVSPEGHHLIDVKFEGTFKLFGEEEPYSRIVEEMEAVGPNLVTTGLLLGLASAAVVACQGGEPRVVELQRAAQQ